MSLNPETGVLGRKKAAHLLRRAVFGFSKSDVDQIANLTSQQAVDFLFTNTPFPEPPLSKNDAEISWVISVPDPDNEKEFELVQQVRAWWLGVILGSRVESDHKLSFSCREKIVFFLHTLVTTSSEVVNSRQLYFQNVLFRKFAFDQSTDFNFKKLINKICIDNAMLVYLDGRLNVKGNPNENFARELLELYTIGKGLDGYIPTSNTPGDYVYFTEQDVQAAARVLTGFNVDNTYSTIDAETELPRGRAKMGSTLIPNQHDENPKVFSHRFDNAIINGRADLLVNGRNTEASMIDEIEQLIDLIFSKEETALHICRRIYRFYVYHQITPEIDQQIIQPMAQEMVNSGFKIEPVIKKLLASQYFYGSVSGANTDDFYGGLIKSPLEIIAQLLSFDEFQIADYLNDKFTFYDQMDELIEEIKEMGMNFYAPFDVAGYEAYHQFPLFNRFWITSNALANRYNFVKKTHSGNMNMGLGLKPFDLVKKHFSDVALDPDLLVIRLAEYLLPANQNGTEITIERLAYFKQQFLSLGEGLPQGPLAFWQFSWNNAANNPNSQEDAAGMLEDLMNAMLQSPEFQLM
ncbi:MAG: DUF1800 family protein [Cytophagales bacterium]